jgi:hypothetical protein
MTMRRFLTSSAIVAISFRKRSVVNADVLSALNEAREQLTSPVDQQ